MQAASTAGSSATDEEEFANTEESRAAATEAYERMLKNLEELQAELGEVADKMAENPGCPEEHDPFWAEMLVLALQLQNSAERMHRRATSQQQVPPST